MAYFITPRDLREIAENLRRKGCPKLAKCFEKWAERIEKCLRGGGRGVRRPTPDRIFPRSNRGRPIPKKEEGE